MNKITHTVKNNRLNLDLVVHTVNATLQLNHKKNIVSGHIQSFKSNDVIDSINDQGEMKPDLVSQFIMKVETFDNLLTQVETYVNENLDKIVSR